MIAIVHIVHKHVKIGFSYTSVSVQASVKCLKWQCFVSFVEGNTAVYVYMYQFPVNHRLGNETSNESNPGHSCVTHVLYQWSYRTAKRHDNCVSENKRVNLVVWIVSVHR